MAMGFSMVMVLGILGVIILVGVGAAMIYVWMTQRED